MSDIRQFDWTAKLAVQKSLWIRNRQMEFTGFSFHDFPKIINGFQWVLREYTCIRKKGVSLIHHTHGISINCLCVCVSGLFDLFTSILYHQFIFLFIVVIFDICLWSSVLLQRRQPRATDRTLKIFLLLCATDTNPHGTMCNFFCCCCDWELLLLLSFPTFVSIWMLIPFLFAVWHFQLITGDKWQRN